MADVLLPLDWNGSMLSIPRASSTQDGYLSKDTFLLFSGGTVVAVTSFNNRTGEIILWEDDVLAALGYVPIDSVKLKKYFPRTWWLADFNASGSPATFIGTIANGSKTLTLTSSTHDFAVGQGIAIVGAGNLQAVNGTNLLVSRITAIAGAVITIADAALHPASGQVVKHDDTVALQTAIDTAYAGKGGTIICDAGHFRLNGPLTNINSIIKFPFIVSYPAASAGIPYAIAITGPPHAFFGWTNPTSDSMTMFQTDRIGVNSDSSMMATALWDNTPANASRLTVYMENLLIRIHDNPQISGLDFRMTGQVLLTNCGIDTQIDMQTASLPTHGTFGLASPVPGVATATSFDMCWVMGFHIGIRISEAFNSNWFVVARCYIALENYPCAHVTYGNGQLSECAIFVNVNGHFPVDMSLDFQSNPASWWSLIHDINDPGNDLTGLLRYTKINAFGDPTPHVVNVLGGEQCNLISLDQLGTALPGPLSLSGDTGAQNLGVRGTLSLFDGSTQEPVSFGANDSAVMGFRNAQIPNSIGSAGERTALWNTNAGVEAPLPGSLNTGLVSFWNCNDASGVGAVDSHGVNNLTSVGTTSVAGHINAALGFNGTSQYQTITNAAQAGLDPGNSDFTMSAWVYLSDNTSSRCILSKSGAGAVDSYILQYDSSANRYQLAVRNNTVSASYTVVSADTFGPPPLNTWTLVVAWFDAGGNGIHIQANNGGVDSIGMAGALPATSTSNVYLGCYSGNLNFWAGRIDAVGFWSRVLST